MKKVLKYVGIVVGVVIVLSIIIPFVVPMSTYKDFIVKKAEENISGKLEIGSMKIKFLPLPGFKLYDVKLSNTTGAFAGQEILSAGQVAGSIKLMPLLKHEISASLKLVKPEVYYRISKAGRANIDDMLVAPVKAEPAKEEKKSSLDIIRTANAEEDKKDAKTEKKASLWKLSAAGFEMDDGRLQYVEEGRQPIEIKGLSARVKYAGDKFNLKADIPKDTSKEALLKLPLSLDLTGIYKAPVIDVKGLDLLLGGSKLAMSGKINTGEGIPVDLAVKVHPIRLDELKAVSPALAPLTGIKDPLLTLKVDGPASNPARLAVSGHFESKHVSYSEYELDNLKSDFVYANSKAALKSLTAALYEGKLKGSADVNVKGNPAYSADVSITDINMAKIPAVKGMILGRGTLNVNASGQGTDEVSIKRNLNATGSVHLANGDIPSLKLGEKIFGNPVWNVLANANVGLNQAKLKELRGLDASCKDFTMTFKAANGVISTNDMKWQHEKYRVTLAGQMTMDERIDFAGKFALLKPSTDTLVSNESARRILVDQRGELSIPFDVTGTASAPNVKPDEKYLGNLFAKAVGELLIRKPVQDVMQNTGKKILDGIFGR